MHYIFSNSLNLENKQLQQLPSGICSTCVCVVLSFNASSTKFAPFDFGNIIFICHKQKHKKGVKQTLRVHPGGVEVHNKQ